MPSWPKTRCWFTSLTLAAAALATGCTTRVPAAPFNVPQRLDALLPADVLLFGEQHDAPDHQRLERDVVTYLAASHKLATLALEMAEQGNNTIGLPADATEDMVRTRLHWHDEAWPWAHYGPVVMAAVRANVSVSGANLPREALRGAMLHEPWDTHLGNPQWQTQRNAIRDGHCDLMPDGQITPMARVQIARDATMAQTVLGALIPGKTVLLIAGGGHVSRDVGVPTHLPQNLTSKVLLALTKYAPEAMDSGADLVWQTAALAPRDYCADLKKQMGR